MGHDTNTPADQKAAEADVECFRGQLGPFVVAAEKTRMAMVFTNARKADNPIVFANDAFLELTGFDREEVLGASCTSTIPAAARPIVSRRYRDDGRSAGAYPERQLRVRRLHPVSQVIVRTALLLAAALAAGAPAAT
eukprot:gene54706-74963_t